MKLIINIDDETYEEIKDRDNTCGIYIPHGYVSIHAIEKGVPLSNIIDTLDEMDLVDYDYHTIQAIKQILNGDEVTH